MFGMSCFFKSTPFNAPNTPSTGIARKEVGGREYSWTAKSPKCPLHKGSLVTRAVVEEEDMVLSPLRLGLVKMVAQAHEEGGHRDLVVIPFQELEEDIYDRRNCQHDR